MVYNLIITEHAEELLDKLVYHLLYVFKNEQAARHLLSEIDGVYAQLEVNPYVYAESKDAYLKSLGYHEAIVPEMNYKIVFAVDETDVTVLGIFHQLEDYQNKL